MGATKTEPKSISPGAGAAYAAGLESLDAEIEVDSLRVSGRFPEWLRGSLIRTGPARWEVGGQPMRHWFDGQAMLHRFGFEDGRVSYANRFVRGTAYRAAEEKGAIQYSEFATDPCRSLFSRVMAMFSPRISDNANVNLTRLGERFAAMTETPMPVEFDTRTLESAGVAWKVPGMLTTAHPHLDRASGGVLNYAAKLGLRNRYRFFRVRPGSRESEIVAELPVREPAYMHSFGLTERWIVLAEFPFVVNPLDLARGRRPYIENYRWKPELGTRITLIDRGSGEPSGPFETEPLFAFHHVNAFERDGEVAVDLCAYPDAGLIEDLYMERLRAGAAVPSADLVRLRVSPGRGTVGREQLTPRGFDLPRINYGRVNERPYRYAWGAGVGDSGWLDHIARADLEAGTCERWSETDCFPGEPVLVAAPRSANGDRAPAEDDGVLLSVVLDGGRRTSFLLVLDARNLEELARAEVPHAIPFGFHGQFDRGPDQRSSSAAT